MAGETEQSEEITVNEMRIRISGGPRRYVAAIIKNGAESWGVDHHVIEMHDGDVVGFMHDGDADHFIGQGRATDLGRWNNMDDLRTAYAEAMAAQQEAPPEQAERRGPGRPAKKKDAA